MRALRISHPGGAAYGLLAALHRLYVSHLYLLLQIFVGYIVWCLLRVRRPTVLAV